jgi:hypothetical protein
VQLTKEDQDNILMIGGIGVFLPFSQGEAEVCVVGDVVIAEEQSQLTMTVTEEEELEQTLEASQAQADEEDERFEERLYDFSQGVERKEVVALNLIAE